jgi:hypothetical protein
VTDPGLFAWLAVAIGAVLSILGIRSTVYFGSKRNGISNWVYDAIFRTVATITGVAIGLTLIRVFALVRGGSTEWTVLIAATLTIWLLLVPALLERTFRKHERR